MPASLLEIIRKSDALNMGQAILDLAQQAVQEHQRGALVGAGGFNRESSRKDHNAVEGIDQQFPNSFLSTQSKDSAETTPYKEVRR